MKQKWPHPLAGFNEQERVSRSNETEWPEHEQRMLNWWNGIAPIDGRMLIQRSIHFHKQLNEQGLFFKVIEYLLK